MMLSFLAAAPEVLVASVVPNPAPVAPPGVAVPVGMILSWLKWGGIIAGVAGLIFCGIQMSIGRRNRSSTAADGAAGVPWVLGGLSVVSFSAGLVGAFI